MRGFLEKNALAYEAITNYFLATLFKMPHHSWFCSHKQMHAAFMLILGDISGFSL